ncbi:hypothetical protein [Cesiribacter sp. SM1]|uniref:hypothetical protein n=1 Tax=Cesiribacter sp. SM1 TaxID=2861196 RepID=UPI001CD74DE7|nr:hypothetical protein [Cesiribacter sp. SM1]
MKKYYFQLLIAVYFVCTGSLYAQNAVYVDGKGVDMNTNIWGTIQQLDRREYSVENEQQYLDKNWLEGEIFMKTGVNIEGFPLRYDLVNQEIEIKAGSEIKVLPLSKVDSFSLIALNGKNKNYVSSITSHNYGNAPNPGCYEKVASADSWSLYKNYTVVLEQPNYNIALNTGSKDAKTKVITTYYFSHEDQTIEVVNSVKKFNEKLPRDIHDATKAYIKENRIKMKNEEDLVKMLSFLNSLTSSN